MTDSNQSNEGFEEHQPSGKKAKGPSMKERLIAQRKAEAAAAAGGEAPAPKKAAPKKAVAKKAPAKKAAVKPVKRAAAAKPAGDGDAPAPKRASGARRSGASSSRRRGGDEGDAEATGGRRGRSKPPEKNMVPIFGGIAVVVIAAGAYFFMQGGDEKPSNAQEQSAAADAEAAKAKADQDAADAQTQADADAKADADAAAAADKAKADKAEADAAKAAEAAKPKEPEGPATEAPRNKKGKQAIFTGEAGLKYPDDLYDPNDSAEVDISQLELFGKAEGCSDDDWSDIQKRAALLGDLESGAAGTRAALKLEKEYGMKSVPALINVLLRLDYSTQEGHEAGDFVQRTLTRISNGRNANWRYGFGEEPNKTTIQNRRTVNVWYGVWAKVVEDPTYWDRFAGQTEAAKRAKKGPAKPEPAEDEGEGLDDLLDDL